MIIKTKIFTQAKLPLSSVLIANIFFCLNICSNNAFCIANDAMKLGVKLSAPTPQPEKYFNDLLHPCVRFISGGFGGHEWWMVASPYRGGDATIENPILYYGDSRIGGLPPLTWTSAGVIEDTPPSGYNSDPNIFFDSNGLWVLWRENGTPDCISIGYVRATFGKLTKDGINFNTKKFFAGEKTGTQDSEMCPIVVNINGTIRLYGSHYQFQPIYVPWGLSIWDIKNNDLVNNSFIKTIDVLPLYKKDFDFWHFDMFQYENTYYCVVSPGSADEILLGKSNDGVNFKFYDTPLISAEGTGASFFYKPSAMVNNGIFYLWYPVMEKGIAPRTSRIWMSEIKFVDLINNLENNGIVPGVVTSTKSYDISKNEVQISNSNFGVSIVASKPTKVCVYSISGILIYQSTEKKDNYLLKLSKGCYVVSTEFNNTKILVE